MLDLRAALQNQPPAEHPHDWAAIHMPGSVQSYGVLLVVEPRSRRVQFVSENCRDILGLNPGDILDKPYTQLCDDEQDRKFLKDRVLPETILFPNPIRLTIQRRAFDAVFHNEGDTHLIEIEATGNDDVSYSELSLRATAELFDPPSVVELQQRAVRMIRDVTGFDRVMLYRFDSRYNGQVIAEASRDGIGSFLGLFFPSADIGARTRDLYLRNFTRYIPDIGASPHRLSGIFPGAGQAESGHPVDLSNVNLRSVFPCHITYLRNIGVQASMSFSINVDGRLWGLFACHHYQPRLVSYDQRVVCEQTAMMFVYRLAVMSSKAAQLAARRDAMALLGQSMRVGTALQQRLQALGRDWSGTAEEKTAHALVACAIDAVLAECGVLLPEEGGTTHRAADRLTPTQKLLLDLVEADSAAIIHNGLVVRIGEAPAEMPIYAINAMFGRELPDLHGADPHVFATDCLSLRVPAASEIKGSAAGILAVALSFDTPSTLMWFRREQIVHATWAGNPSADALAAGSDGSNPRASFAAWKQDIKDLSRPWQMEDVEIANEIGTILRSLSEGEHVTPQRVRPPSTAWQANIAHTSSPTAEPAKPHQASRQVIRIGQR
jgi:light-regulated signal transduction histidine kinase (bacteriophytochrome)